jgi:uncharacterized protein (TIGR02246 family)
VNRSLSSVADELAINDLVADFADAASRLDAGAVTALFAPDGIWEVPNWGTNQGHKNIRSFVDELFSHWDGLFHAAHTSRVWLDGDRASGRWQISEFGTRDGQELRVAGVYEDEYIRVDEKWLFARRRFNIVFRRIGGCSEVETWPPPDR